MKVDYGHIGIRLTPSVLARFVHLSTGNLWVSQKWISFMHPIFLSQNEHSCSTHRRHPIQPHEPPHFRKHSVHIQHSHSVSLHTAPCLKSCPTHLCIPQWQQSPLSPSYSLCIEMSDVSSGSSASTWAAVSIANALLGNDSLGHETAVCGKFNQTKLNESNAH